MIQKKQIWIEIDFILRDWLNALVGVYTKQIDDFETEITDLNNIWEYFKFPVYIEIEQPTADDVDVFERIVVIDEGAEPEANKDYFYKFMNDNVLEVFAYAKESVKDAMLHINELQKNNLDCEIILYSTCKGKAIPATYYFLSATGCEIKNLKFLSVNDFTYDSNIDVLITANAKILETVGSAIKNFYIENPFNSEIVENCLLGEKIHSIKDILSFT